MSEKPGPGLDPVVAWSGQFEYAERASERLAIIVPLTIGVIFLLLHMAFRRLREPLIGLVALLLALVGGVRLVYLLGAAISVTTAVGFIALAGLAAEFGVIMLSISTRRSRTGCGWRVLDHRIWRTRSRKTPC